MAFTSSSMLETGTKAPDFNLSDTITGQYYSLDQSKGTNATLVMFICNHCPYVKHVQPELVRLAKEFQNEGVGFIAISSNDAESYPEDAPDKMRDEALRLNYSFPYLYDETQDIARAYKAACTPDFFLFDKDLRLVYRGQLDDSRPGNEKPLTGKDLRAALDDVLKGNPVSEDQMPSQGCNIKWK